MSLSLIFFSFVVAMVWVGGSVLFKAYPESAISVARNTLFSLRDELFDLALARNISFESPGYQVARMQINAMIRFAHDISFMQMFITRHTLNRASREFSDDFARRAKASLMSLPKEDRVKVLKILDRATSAMVQLMVTRSVLASMVLAVFIACHQFSRVGAEHVKRLRQVQARTSKEESQVQEAIGEMLAHRPMRGMKPAIRLEAHRYARELDEGLLCAA